MKLLKIIGLVIITLLVLPLLIFFRRDIPIETMKERYANEQSRFFPTEGMEVHYRVEGNGPALLLIHGTSSSLHTWDGWVEELADSFQIIRIDLPGFGLTGPHPKSDYSAAMYNRVLFSLMDSLGIDTFYVAGNSLGGYISWNMAVADTHRVRKVILLDAVAFTDSLPVEGVKVKDRGHTLAFALARNPFFSIIARWVTPKFLVKNSLLEVYGDDSKVSPELVDRYYDLIRSQGNRKAFVDNVKSRVYEGNEQKLPSLQTPVLIQWGSEDLWVDLSLGEWFQAILPNATLAVYEGIGHVPMEELPSETAIDAREFLLRH
jgi:pimeloyl-ACP methyl ester carboxylesterase